MFKKIVFLSLLLLPTHDALCAGGGVSQGLSRTHSQKKEQAVPGAFNASQGLKRKEGSHKTFQMRRSIQCKNQDKRRHFGCMK
jgi:hypothetical protein